MILLHALALAVFLSLSHLVDDNGERRLHAGLQVFLSLVAEEICSFEDTVHRGPALRVTS